MLAWKTYHTQKHYLPVIWIHRCSLMKSWLRPSEEFPKNVFFSFIRIHLDFECSRSAFHTFPLAPYAATLLTRRPLRCEGIPGSHYITHAVGVTSSHFPAIHAPQIHRLLVSSQSSVWSGLVYPAEDILRKALLFSSSQYMVKAPSYLPAR